MNNRIEDLFAVLRQSSRTGLVAYTTAGFPDLEGSTEIIHELGKVADAVEIGVPCANPFADGPIIRRSHELALARFVSPELVLNMVRELRRANFVKPIVLMLYLELVQRFGPARLFSKALDVGVDGVLIPDLSRLVDLRRLPVAVQNTPLIPFVSPDIGEDMLAELLRKPSSFIYMAAGSGRSGGALISNKALAAGVARIRDITDFPVAMGIGIKTPEDARRVAQFSDAVVIGTAVVDLIFSHIGPEGHLIDGWRPSLRRFLASIIEAIND